MGADGGGVCVENVPSLPAAWRWHDRSHSPACSQPGAAQPLLMHTDIDRGRARTFH